MYVDGRLIDSLEGIRRCSRYFLTIYIYILETLTSHEGILANGGKRARQRKFGQFLSEFKCIAIDGFMKSGALVRTDVI